MANGQSPSEREIEERLVEKFFYLTFYLTIAAVFLTNCSSTSRVEITNSNVQSKTATNKSIVSAVNQPDTNVEVSTNINAVVIQNSLVSKRNMDQLRSKGGGDTNAAPIPAVEATPNPAPDNSEIFSTMIKGQPIETRTFKNHPVLAKTVRNLVDAANPTMKVYLKNGKILDVPPGAAANLSLAPADEILQAVGISMQKPAR